MPSLFSRIRGKDGPSKLKSKKNAQYDDDAHQLSNKPRWDDAYTRTSVEPEEIQELVSRCTEELKARGKNRVSLPPLLNWTNWMASHSSRSPLSPLAIPPDF